MMSQSSSPVSVVDCCIINIYDDTKLIVVFSVVVVIGYSIYHQHGQGWISTLPIV